MTLTLPSTLHRFIEGIRRLDPNMDIRHDAPEDEGASHWIDVRSDRVFITVEYNPKLGFGFSAEPNVSSALYGTPSERFIPNTDDAISHFNQIVIGLKTSNKEPTSNKTPTLQERKTK